MKNKKGKIKRWYESLTEGQKGFVATTTFIFLLILSVWFLKTILKEWVWDFIWGWGIVILFFLVIAWIWYHEEKERKKNRKKEFDLTKAISDYVDREI